MGELGEARAQGSAHVGGTDWKGPEEARRREEGRVKTNKSVLSKSQHKRQHSPHPAASPSRGRPKPLLG